MALGDGITWDETTPTDGTSAVQIDDYNRDLRLGFRSRFAMEHEMPASQSSTAEGGKHKFLTLQAQAIKPTVSGTQIAALYADTANNLSFEKSDGTVIPIVVGTAVVGGAVIPTSGLALALTGTQFPAGTALLGNNITMYEGSTANGGLVLLASGYSSAKSFCMVSLPSVGAWQNGVQSFSVAFVRSGSFGHVTSSLMDDSAVVTYPSVKYVAIGIK